MWKWLKRLLTSSVQNTYVTAAQARDYLKTRVSKPCTHPHMQERRSVSADRTPMICWYCPDCGYFEHGHVHGDLDGWL